MWRGVWGRKVGGAQTRPKIEENGRILHQLCICFSWRDTVPRSAFLKFTAHRPSSLYHTTSTPCVLESTTAPWRMNLWFIVHFAVEQLLRSFLSRVKAGQGWWYLQCQPYARPTYEGRSGAILSGRTSNRQPVKADRHRRKTGNVRATW